jgi:hypothetical protein
MAVLAAKAPSTCVTGLIRAGGLRYVSSIDNHSTSISALSRWLSDDIGTCKRIARLGFAESHRFRYRATLSNGCTARFIYAFISDAGD